VPDREQKMEAEYHHIGVDTSVIEINGLAYLQHQARKMDIVSLFTISKLYFRII
jgi:hypothetical protein